MKDFLVRYTSIYGVEVYSKETGKLSEYRETGVFIWIGEPIWGVALYDMSEIFLPKYSSSLGPIDFDADRYYSEITLFFYRYFCDKELLTRLMSDRGLGLIKGMEGLLRSPKDSATISICGYSKYGIKSLTIETSSFIYKMTELKKESDIMKYSKEYINSLSFREYLELMADELNENGYKTYSGSEYTVSDAPILFMMQPIEDPKAMCFLTLQGLIGNGRCPQCGAPMSNNNYFWYDRRDPSRKFNVCYGCSISNGHGDGYSMDGCPEGLPSKHSSNSGCMVGLLLLPIFIIKFILHL